MPEIKEQTRMEKAKAAHTAASKSRADKINEVKASFKKIKDEPAFQHILLKAREFAGYHSKMAKDGVGYRQTGALDANGNPIQETVFFDHNKRVTEMDKAAGIEELIDYVERQITDDALTPVVAKKAVS
jgi:hypothetical protein